MGYRDVNVLNYGARGDGVQDDATALQNAINAATGRVIVPPGTYLIGTALTITSRIHLMGLGGHDDAANGDAPAIIKKAATLNGTGITVTHPGGAGAIISNLTVDGVAGNGGDGIQINANGVTLRDVCVFNQGQDGIHVGGSLNANSWTLDHVNTSSNTRHGVFVDSSTGGPDANAGVAMHIVALSNGSDGVNVARATLNTFINILGESNTGVVLRFTANAQYNKVIGGDFAEQASSITIEAGALENVLIGLGESDWDGVSDSGTNTAHLGSRVGVGGIPQARLHVSNAPTAASASAQVFMVGGNVTAGSDNDLLILIRDASAPEFRTSAKTGVTAYGIRLDPTTWTKSGGGSLSQAYGIRIIGDPTIGTTDNCALYVSGGGSIAKLFPGDADHKNQCHCTIMAGQGVPANANGQDGDFFFRSDGTVAGNTVIYHRQGGSWVALTTT